ncbi:hypothetical protein BGZ70_009239 [Mortierella alpina]|uniref:Uncharacterized protein n=1 Tax=Mortierella alpina TaxID=64518 RepID=A0A9P6M0W4_MORAP|nr:hypothetical protein BGZ70_009239 [Mortierella alpina]
MVILVRVWIENAGRKRPSDCIDDTDQLSSIMAAIGKGYLLWALSPDMQDAALNQAYLESSYPLILDLIAPLCSLQLSDSLNEILICLASGPWFTNLSTPKLWSLSSDAMDIDGITGEQQLARSLLRIMEGKKTLLRLQSDPGILHAFQSFHLQASKAMRVMATFPRCCRLDAWRNALLVNSLKLDRGSLRMSSSESSTGLRTIATLESLAVLSTRCPDTKSVIETAISSLVLEDEHEETRLVLASCMGVIACGIANAGRQAEATYSYDGTPLLNSIYRFYCHLSVTDADVVDVDMNDGVAQDFRDFVTSLLGDPDDEIRDAAGYIVELLAKRMGEYLADDPLRPTGNFKDMLAIQEAVATFFVGSLSGQQFRWQLELCGRIMRHLPEDSLTYHALLCMMIDHAFLDRSRSRSSMVFYVLSRVAHDKGVTKYRLLQPRMDYICGKIIQMQESGRDGQLQEFYSWSGLS